MYAAQLYTVATLVTDHPQRTLVGPTTEHKNTQAIYETWQKDQCHQPHSNTARQINAMTFKATVLQETQLSSRNDNMVLVKQKKHALRIHE